MLVLSRSKADKIVFPSLGITIEILRISGQRVQVGIDAPIDIPVHRSEVVDRDYCGEVGRKRERARNAEAEAHAAS